MKKMYTERKANIAAFRGCDFNCLYCAFKHTMSRSKCPLCRTFTPHAHLEVLDKRPPPTKDGEFLTMGLNGDIAFATGKELRRMIEYCNQWHDRTFVLQTKDPWIFTKFKDVIQPNMIIGTTIETDKSTTFVSKAPPVDVRYDALVNMPVRKMLTIEPIMEFTDDFAEIIYNFDPEIVYIGYDSKNNHLPEPTSLETKVLIGQLRGAGIDVREKLIRKAWDEK